MIGFILLVSLIREASIPDLYALLASPALGSIYIRQDREHYALEVGDACSLTDRVFQDKSCQQKLPFQQLHGQALQLGAQLQGEEGAKISTATNRLRQSILQIFNLSLKANGSDLFLTIMQKMNFLIQIF